MVYVQSAQAQRDRDVRQSGRAHPMCQKRTSTRFDMLEKQIRANTKQPEDLYRLLSEIAGAGVENKSDNEEEEECDNTCESNYEDLAVGLANMFI